MTSMERISVVLGLLAAALTPALTQAQAVEPSYNYAGAGLFLADSDGNDADGFNLEGSVALTDRLHLLAEYADGDLDEGADDDVENLRIALGGRLPIRSAGTSMPTDFVLRLGWVDAELGPDDDDGISIEALVRSMLSDQFELNLGGEYVDLDEGDLSDDIRLNVGAVYSFTPNWAVRGNFGISDDISTFELGVRYYFGDIF